MLFLFITIFAVSVASLALAAGAFPTVKVGDDPNGIAYDLGKGEVFVANNAGNTVSVISDSNNEVVETSTVASLSLPYDLAYDSAKGETFVTNSGSNTVSILSDSSQASQSPTAPEFSIMGFVFVASIMVVMVFVAAKVALRNRKIASNSLCIKADHYINARIGRV